MGELHGHSLAGERAFILGNGPSISDHDLSLLADHFTIGINRAYKLIDPTILMWQDRQMWNEYKDFKHTQALKLCRDTIDRLNICHHFHLISSKPYQLTTNPQLLYGRGSTGPLAVQVAAALGCDPIILLGMDCKHRGDRTDFYGRNKDHNESTMSNCTLGLQWIASLTTPQIINCSDNDVFPKRHELREVVASLGKGKGRDYYAQRIIKDNRDAARSIMRYDLPH